MQGSQGVTLVETLAAVAVGGVLAGSAGVVLPRLADAVRLAGSARTIATTLRLARGEALARGAAVDVPSQLAAVVMGSLVVGMAITVIATLIMRKGGQSE